MSEPWALDVTEAGESIAAGRLSPEELFDSCKARIEELDPHIQSWEHLNFEMAGSLASMCSDGPLHGVPAGVKDIFNTDGMPTTMGSPVWEGFNAGNDARVVFNLKKQGGYVMGKTVTAEFAVHAPGVTRNPHDVRRSPGTSSSGSAAVVASGMVPWALGSQTAGSIVRPASYCGVFGFKPSYGTVPRTGMLKTTDTLDQIGFFCRSPRDLPLLLEAIRIRGRDYPLVEATLDKEVLPPELPSRPRIGVLTDSIWVWDNVETAYRNTFSRYVDQLQEAGADVSELALPGEFAMAHEVHETIYNKCISYYFAVEAAQGQLVSSEIMEMVERGRATSMQAYVDALESQVKLQHKFGEVLKDFDALLTLSTAGPAPLWREPDLPDTALIWTLCGAPVVSVPALRTPEGLPYGVQLVSSRFSDHRLLAVLASVETMGAAAAVEPVTPTVAEGLSSLEQAI